MLLLVVQSVLSAPLLRATQMPDASCCWQLHTPADCTCASKVGYCLHVLLLCEVLRLPCMPMQLALFQAPPLNLTISQPDKAAVEAQVAAMTAAAAAGVWASSMSVPKSVQVPI